ncbi:MAG TPA: hypothetical protein VEX38_06915 [Fimbriimonadaceae bacterium]|nr:hypothetical protein [Fimbriimonadaceae bacterium]
MGLSGLLRTVAAILLFTALLSLFLFSIGGVIYFTNVGRWLEAVGVLLLAIAAGYILNRVSSRNESTGPPFGA